MEKFIHSQNLLHYRTLLADPTISEETRRILERLLDEEVKKDECPSASDGKLQEGTRSFSS